MKKVLILGSLFIALGVTAQAGSGFGFKAGVNYSGNGKYFDSARNAFEDPQNNAGFHLGLFGKIGNQIYLRPELIYTQTNSEYDQGDLKIQKIDAPILLGIKVLGPLHAFAGPSFQYLLETEFDGITIGDVENDFTVGAHFGFGVNIGKFGIDLRYERGFNENEISFINNNILTLSADRVDTRPEQLILSFVLKL